MKSFNVKIKSFSMKSESFHAKISSVCENENFSRKFAFLGFLVYELIKKLFILPDVQSITTYLPDAAADNHQVIAALYWNVRQERCFLHLRMSMLSETAAVSPS